MGAVTVSRQNDKQNQHGGVVLLPPVLYSQGWQTAEIFELLRGSLLHLKCTRGNTGKIHYMTGPRNLLLSVITEKELRGKDPTFIGVKTSSVIPRKGRAWLAAP